MSVNPFAVILKDFEDDLDRAVELLNLVAKFRTFAASPVPTEVSSEVVPWEPALKLAQAASSVRTDLPILAGSILLYLCGRFENYIRDLVIAMGEEFAQKANQYEDLPESVRAEIFTRTMEVAQNPSKYSYKDTDVPRIVEELSNSLNSTASGSVVIEARLLAITESNMNQRMLSEIFKRVNIDKVWQEIGKQAQMKTLLGKADDSQCTKEATTRLDELMKERNKIAHPTAATTFPDSTQVKDHVAFLRALSKVVHDLAAIPRS